MKTGGFMKYFIAMALLALSACTGTGDNQRIPGPGEKICDAGNCACPDGFTDCGEFSCVDLQTSHSHCGECGNDINDHFGADVCIEGKEMCGGQLTSECEDGLVCRPERDVENAQWVGYSGCKEALSPECGEGMADNACGTGKVCVGHFCALDE